MAGFCAIVPSQQTPLRAPTPKSRHGPCRRPCSKPRLTLPSNGAVYGPNVPGDGHPGAQNELSGKPSERICDILESRRLTVYLVAGSACDEIWARIAVTSGFGATVTFCATERGRNRYTIIHIFIKKRYYTYIIGAAQLAYGTVPPRLRALSPHRGRSRKRVRPSTSAGISISLTSGKNACSQE